MKRTKRRAKVANRKPVTFGRVVIVRKRATPQSPDIIGDIASRVMQGWPKGPETMLFRSTMSLYQPEMRRFAELVIRESRR